MKNIIIEGIVLMRTTFPGEWNESIMLKLDDEPLAITFKDGAVAVTTGGCGDAQSIIELSRRRMCDIIDGSREFMTVWRELAEPSPTDRTYIKKGTGAKFFVLLDGLIKCYASHPAFKKLLDDYKGQLKG